MTDRRPPRPAPIDPPVTEDEVQEQSHAGPVRQGDGDEGTAEPRRQPTLEDVARADDTPKDET